MLAGSDKLVEKGNQHFASKFLDSTTEGIKDNARIKRKLLKQAKSQGIKVVESPGFSNSAYVGTDAGRLLRKGLASGMKWGRKSGNREIAESLKSVSETLNDQLGGVSGFGKDQIVMGLGSDNAAVLAHELGHAQHYEGRSKDILGKAAHKLHAPSSTAINILNNAAKVEGGETVKNIGNSILAADGFRRGKNSVYTDYINDFFYTSNKFWTKYENIDLCEIYTIFNLVCCISKIKWYCQCSSLKNTKVNWKPLKTVHK